MENLWYPYSMGTTCLESRGLYQRGSYYRLRMSFPIQVDTFSPVSFTKTIRRPVSDDAFSVLRARCRNHTAMISPVADAIDEGKAKVRTIGREIDLQQHQAYIISHFRAHIISHFLPVVKEQHLVVRDARNPAESRKMASCLVATRGRTTVMSHSTVETKQPGYPRRLAFLRYVP